jgi:hypothetical protein
VGSRAPPEKIATRTWRSCACPELLADMELMLPDWSCSPRRALTNLGETPVGLLCQGSSATRDPPCQGTLQDLLPSRWPRPNPWFQAVLARTAQQRGTGLLNCRSPVPFCWSVLTALSCVSFHLIQHGQRTSAAVVPAPRAAAVGGDPRALRASSAAARREQTILKKWRGPVRQQGGTL